MKITKRLSLKYGNKKSLLFTAMVLLVLGSILVATISFVNRSEEIGFMINDNLITYKIANIKADIAQDYMDIIRINNAKTYVDSNFAVVNLSFVISKSIPSYIPLLNEYAAFIKDIYSPMINVFILPDLGPSFEIYPYQTRCILNSTAFSANFSSDLLKSVEIIGTVNSTVAKITASSLVTQPGNKSLKLFILDKNNRTVINQTILVDMTKNNLCYFEFNTSSSNISISYSRFTINLSNSKFVSSVNNSISASLSVSFVFNSSQKNKIYLKTGNNSIFSSGPGNITLKGPLDLMSG
jgi:hypothetical protein